MGKGWRSWVCVVWNRKKDHEWSSGQEDMSTIQTYTHLLCADKPLLKTAKFI